MKTLSVKELQQVITPKVLLNAYDELEYDYFESKFRPFNLNFGAIRSNDLKSNNFNDVFFYLWMENKQWKLWTFPGTSDPGLYYRNHPMNRAGTGIMIPQQSKQHFAIAGPMYQNRYGSRHRGHGKTGYTCLRQDKKAYFVRDNDQDDELNVLENVKECKEAGLNVIYDNISANHHRGSKWQINYKVDKFSGACQVTESFEDYKKEMKLWKFANQYWGRFLTYTLFVENTILRTSKLI